MRIGILGGTFDPIHCGHVYLARTALERMGLDQVVLMVAGTPPHKRQQPRASSFHRFTMAALATLDEPGLFVSTRELEKETPSYTIETLAELQAESPGDQFCFIAGGDSLREIHIWRDYARLLSSYCFLFFNRAGVEIELEKLAVPSEIRQRIRRLDSGAAPISPGTSYLFETDPPDVSSTELRHVLSEGGTPGPGKLPEIVWRHIRKYRLYG